MKHLGRHLLDSKDLKKKPSDWLDDLKSWIASMQ